MACWLQPAFYPPHSTGIILLGKNTRISPHFKTLSNISGESAFYHILLLPDPLRAPVPCSFFCMTTNMTRGEPTVHQEGLLWKLVRASMTIVGLIPPVYENGELLIDGGYLNNMPVDVMRGLGVDTVSPPPVSPLAAHRGPQTGLRYLFMLQ